MTFINLARLCLCSSAIYSSSNAFCSIFCALSHPFSNSSFNLKLVPFKSTFIEGLSGCSASILISFSTSLISCDSWLRSQDSSSSCTIVTGPSLLGDPSKISIGSSNSTACSSLFCYASNVLLRFWAETSSMD